jgi:Protein of unknown function (DUF4231)
MNLPWNLREKLFGSSSDKNIRIYNPPEDALNERIARFERDANKYKFRFRLFQATVIVASGILPIVNLVDLATFQTRLISSMLGSLIVIVTAMTQMDKNHEMWILKASVEHELKGEKLLFSNSVKPYTRKNPEENQKLLIRRMDDIISSHLESYFKRAGEKDKS